MVAGQKMVAANGYEVMLFPLPYMDISQGENGAPYHLGTYNIDFLGYNAEGQHISDAPYYAPCSCICVRAWDETDGNGRFYQSLDKVNTPTGLKYVSFLFIHDENPIAHVGSIFNQGDLIGHTGTAGNVTGDHVHMNMANGLYAGYEHVPPAGKGQLVNSTHIYDICYVNDTTIIDGYGYLWQMFRGKLKPTYPTYNKNHFKWVLYANKLRNKNIV